LKRDNTRLGQMLSEVKGMLANAKAAHEDMEASCAHMIAQHQLARKEIECLKKQAKPPASLASSFSFRS